MTKHEGSEARQMARKQKNAFLDEELCRLVDAFQAQVGATFSRINSAALLQFFFSEPAGPDMQWIKMAVAVEKGELPSLIKGKSKPFSIGDVPLELDREAKQLAFAEAQETEKGDPRAHHIAVERLAQASRRLYAWEEMKKETGNLVDGLVAYWHERDRIASSKELYGLYEKMHQELHEQGEGTNPDQGEGQSEPLPDWAPIHHRGPDGEWKVSKYGDYKKTADKQGDDQEPDAAE